MDQISSENHSPIYNYAPTDTKFCMMWEGWSLLYVTKFHNVGQNAGQHDLYLVDPQYIEQVNLFDKGKPGGEPTKVKCNYIWGNVITFAQM